MTDKTITDLDVNSYYPEPPMTLDQFATITGKSGVVIIDEAHYYLKPAMRYATKIALSSAYGHIATRYRFVEKLSRKKRRLAAQIARRNNRNILAGSPSNGYWSR